MREQRSKSLQGGNNGPTVTLLRDGISHLASISCHQLGLDRLITYCRKLLTIKDMDFLVGSAPILGSSTK